MNDKFLVVNMSKFSKAEDLQRLMNTNLTWSLVTCGCFEKTDGGCTHFAVFKDNEYDTLPKNMRTPFVIPLDNN